MSEGGGSGFRWGVTAEDNSRMAAASVLFELATDRCTATGHHQDEGSDGTQGPIHRTAGHCRTDDQERGLPGAVQRHGLPAAGSSRSQLAPLRLQRLRSQARLALRPQLVHLGGRCSWSYGRSSAEYPCFPRRDVQGSSFGVYSSEGGTLTLT